jgi:hypothetical protein
MKFTENRRLAELSPGMSYLIAALKNEEESARDEGSLASSAADILKASSPWEVSMTSTTFHDAFLGPTDLALAKRILDGVCAERGIEMESREADELAASVIRQVQRGTRDEERLMTLFGTAKTQRRRAMAPAKEMPRHATR